MKYQLLIFCALIGYCGNPNLHASSVSTPASIAARNLQNAVEKFIASGGSANAVTYDIILSYFQPEAEYHLAQVS